MVDGVTSIVETVRPNTVVADLLNLAKLQTRDEVEYSPNDELLLRYLGAAVIAAEQYIFKDIIGRSYVVRWTAEAPLRIICGKVENLDVQTGTPPVSVLTQFARRGSAEFRSTEGLTIWLPNAVATVSDSLVEGAYVLTFDSGFTSGAAVPDGVLQFVLAAYGMFDQNRELAGVGGSTWHQNAFPLYLLDALDAPVFA